MRRVTAAIAALFLVPLVFVVGAALAGAAPTSVACTGSASGSTFTVTCPNPQVTVTRAGPTQTVAGPTVTVTRTVTAAPTTAAPTPTSVAPAPTTVTPTLTPTSVAPTPTVTPAPAGFPDATTAGYLAAPDYAGQTLPACVTPIVSNASYRFCKFADGAGIGSAASPVSNVSFYGVLFASNAVADANVADYGDGITFTYCTFAPTAGTPGAVAYSKGYQYGIDKRSAGSLTVDHSDFWGWGNGIQFGTSTVAKPVIIRDSYFHDARDDGGGIDHTDAILSNEGGPTGVVITHNTVVSVGNTQGLALQTESRAYSGLTITDNYFAGFGYTVAIGETIPCSNVIFTGNVLGTDIKPVWGPLYSDTNFKASGNVWSGNTWNVVPGTTWAPSAADGKFWLPDGTYSATDY